jgi:excisionase family DNA binding protein
VDNWIRKGDIPYIRLGDRKNLFKLSEVDEALKRRFQMNRPA